MIDAVAGRRRTFVGCEIPDEVRPAARDRLTPVTGIFLERIAAERVDSVANEAGDGHRDSSLVSVVERRR